MVVALFAWLLGLFGVAPTKEDFARYEREFRERNHHVFVEFAGTRYHGTRWTDDDFYKEPAIGLGYDYLVDRKYNGVGFELYGQSLGKVFNAREHSHNFNIVGGFDYYPIRDLRLFSHGGVNIDDKGHARALGRAGIGYRIMFFNIGMQPFVYMQSTSDGTTTWTLGARIEF